LIGEIESDFIAAEAAENAILLGTDLRKAILQAIEVAIERRIMVVNVQKLDGNSMGYITDDVVLAEVISKVIGKISDRCHVEALLVSRDSIAVKDISMLDTILKEQPNLST
jgi:hypothetical protein